MPTVSHDEISPQVPPCLSTVIAKTSRWGVGARRLSSERALQTSPPPASGTSKEKALWDAVVGRRMDPNAVPVLQLNKIVDDGAGVIKMIMPKASCCPPCQRAPASSLFHESTTWANLNPCPRNCQLSWGAVQTLHDLTRSLAKHGRLETPTNNGGATMPAGATQGNLPKKANDLVVPRSW